MITSVDAHKIKKILIFTLSNIGDVILNTPVISAIRENFPSSFLCVLVGPKGVPILTGSRMIDELVVYDKHGSWSEKLALVHRLRKEKFDLIVDLRNSAIPFLVGSRYRTSYFVDRSSVSMRKQHLDRIRFLISVDNSKNQFDFYSESEKDAAFHKLRIKLPNVQENNFIILGPGAGHPLKRWTLSGFAEVMNYFLAMGKDIVLLGWELEAGLGIELERKASRPIANFIGGLSLRESASLIGQASLIIANDSAIMHLSHELNRPTVSLFGPTNPEKYGQTGKNRRIVRLTLDCIPCEVTSCRLERRICLDDLPATTVIQTCEELLNHAANSSIRH